MKRVISFVSRSAKALTASLPRFKSGNTDLFDRLKSFDVLRQKWHEVPSGDGRVKSSDVMKLSDEDLILYHAECTKKALDDCRAWYHQLYKDVLRGKRVLDVGSGFGIDGIAFAREGAYVTFLDIVEDNILVLKRLCRLLKIENVEFLYMKDLSSLAALRNDFDVIWCDGSLIHAPFDIIRLEVKELVKHLKPQGRWIELCYPKERWKREGSMPFERWGEKTDGDAPWVEWYDLPKLRARFDPIQFDVILHFNFHNNDYNWFDLNLKPQCEGN